MVRVQSNERDHGLTAHRAATDWQKIIMAAHRKCRTDGGNWEEVYPKTLDDMMNKFRAHKAATDREAAEKAAADIEE
jgi:hypothetical protein